MPPSNHRKELEKQVLISDIFSESERDWRKTSRTMPEGKHEDLETSLMNAVDCSVTVSVGGVETHCPLISSHLYDQALGVSLGSHFPLPFQRYICKTFFFLGPFTFVYA